MPEVDQPKPEDDMISHHTTHRVRQSAGMAGGTVLETSEGVTGLLIPPRRVSGVPEAA